MTPQEEMTVRMYVVLAALAAVPLLVAGRLVWIQAAEGPQLEARSQEQAHARIELPALRGQILDRHGRALAVNTARYDLAADPTVEGFAAQEASFFEKLSGLTGRPASAYRRAVEERSSPQYVRLARDLAREAKEQIAGWGVPGLVLTPRFGRRYTYGRTAAHLLGYTGADGQGLAGLELQYDDFLRGTPGYRIARRDRQGHIEALVGGKAKAPHNGQNLRLTIDLVRQTVLEDELQRGLEESGANWGAAVAMDPKTGAILAMSSAPTYDPNRPNAARPSARRNRTITDQLEPGSTFKLVTAAAALEQHVLGLDDSVDTGPGYAVLGGRTLHDTHAHGTIPFRDVIVKSSNIGTAKTAQRMKPGTFYRQARALGFGERTWVDLPGEVGGMLRKPYRWSRTSQTRMAIGYEVTLTPLQLVVAYSALANGGLVVQPHVVAERETMTGEVTWTPRLDSVRRAFGAETARKLRPVFEQVVSEEGTARRAKIEGLPIAGKTGTAKKVKHGRYRSGAYRASFVGFFPADDPEVALAVVYDEPETSIYGGVVAAPVFRRIARRWAGTFPKVATRLAAARRASRRAARREDAPDAAPPAPRVPARPLPDEAQALPDFAGHTTREARYWLAARGVSVQLDGAGAVVAAQAPAPGTPLPDRATLTAH